MPDWSAETERFTRELSSNTNSLDMKCAEASGGSAWACLTTPRGNFIVTHGGRDLCKLKAESCDGEASAALKCHAFWTHYFNVFCQRPEDKMRLFPTQEAFPHLYTSTFLPYAENLGWKSIPKLRCFETVACTHPDFADVKKRKQHTHCRCSQCADCKAALRRGFRTKTSSSSTN